MTDSHTLAQDINLVLPQTQCTQCGYAGCAPYAEAIALAHAPINQCPPGGHKGIVELARLTGRAVIPLNPQHGTEQPRKVAHIIEAQCIGCTKCIQACPVDAIIGASKLMHVILTDLCTGCELCVAPCPVDCIVMPVAESAEWLPSDAQKARQRFEYRNQRLAREILATQKKQKAAQPSIVEAALARARARRQP